MASDALDKYNDKSSSFTARHKLAVIICLSISCAILFIVYMSNQGEGESVSQMEDQEEEEDDDYWMDEEDLMDDDYDYWMKCWDCKNIMKLWFNKFLRVW